MREYAFMVLPEYLIIFHYLLSLFDMRLNNFNKQYRIILENFQSMNGWLFIGLGGVKIKSLTLEIML